MSLQHREHYSLLSVIQNHREIIFPDIWPAGDESAPRNTQCQVIQVVPDSQRGCGRRARDGAVSGALSGTKQGARKHLLTVRVLYLMISYAIGEH
jgi:hypothetical protein